MIAATHLAYNRAVPAVRPAMPERLLLRISADGAWSWLAQASGRPSGQVHAGLPPADVHQRAGEIVLLLPAADVLLAPVSLKVRSRAQLEQALPYALEERIVGNVEDHHFAAGNVDGVQGAAVVARELLDGWLQQLADAGIVADAALPETLLLPNAGDGVHVLVDDEGVIARRGPWSAFACPSMQLSQWLALAAAGDSLQVQVDDLRSQPDPGLQLPADAQVTRHEPGRLRWLAGRVADIPLNLLSGAYAVRHRGSDMRLWWRRAAGLAAAAVLLAFVSLAVQVVQLSRSATRLDTAMHDVVRKVLPEVSAQQLASSDPLQLVSGQLGPGEAARASDGLLATLTRIGPVLGGTTRVQTRAMEFRSGALELGLRAPDVATLDSMREAFAARGLQADVIAAHAEEDHVDGRIRIRGSQP